MINSQDLKESKKTLMLKKKILIVFMQLKTSLNPVLVLCTLHISLNISPDFESGMAFRSNQFLQIYKIFQNPSLKFQYSWILDLSFWPFWS